MNDHLAAPVRELLALYAEKYSDVQFPGLDLAILDAAAADVAKAHAKVVEAEASIQPLRDQAKAVEGELTQKVVRALAFLKVHVEGDPDEYSRLDTLTQSLLARRVSRKSADPNAVAAGDRPRRGRKPKAAAEAADAAEASVSAEQLAEADLPSSALSAFEPAAE